jgi:hypothetical protein
MDAKLIWQTLGDDAFFNSKEQISEQYFQS